jgi:hypothetical protein
VDESALNAAILSACPIVRLRLPHVRILENTYRREKNSTLPSQLAQENGYVNGAIVSIQVRLVEQLFTDALTVERRCFQLHTSYGGLRKSRVLSPPSGSVARRLPQTTGHIRKFQEES